MITRIFQVTTRPGKDAEFAEFFHRTAIQLMKGTEGIVQVLPGAPRPETPRDFSFVMIWRDLDALKAFVGENYQSPHIDTAEAELVESRTIRHHDFVGTETIPLLSGQKYSKGTVPEAMAGFRGVRAQGPPVSRQAGARDNRRQSPEVFKPGGDRHLAVPLPARGPVARLSACPEDPTGAVGSSPSGKSDLSEVSTI